MYNIDKPTRAELPSTRQLLRATAWAALTAAVLLSTVVLPSEYGMDPTGLSKVLGFAKMGEIKNALASDAAAEAQPKPLAAAAPAVIATPVATESSAVTARSDTMQIILKPGERLEMKMDMLKAGFGISRGAPWSTRCAARGLRKSCTARYAVLGATPYSAALGPAPPFRALVRQAIQPLPQLQQASPKGSAYGSLLAS